MTIQSGTDASVGAQLREVSEQTGGVVPSCAFGLPGNCPGGTIASGNNCVLRFTIATNGSGLTTAAADGIAAIVKYTTFDVYNQPRDDGNGATVDTSLFLTRVVANTPDETFRPPADPEHTCWPFPTAGSFHGAPFNNGFYDFSTGTSLIAQEGAKLFFTVYAQNGIVEEGTSPQIFYAYIDILDDTTGSLLDTQSVVIIVPAAPGGAGE
jgi:hypothetical protein